MNGRMKVLRRVLAVVIAAAALVAPALAAQVPRDLSGTWRLDPALSGPQPTGQPPVVMVVQQDADRLTMEHRVGAKSTTSTYVFDGSPSATTSSIGRQAVGKARWEKGKLVVEGAEKTPSGGSLVLRVEIECSVDGSTLVVTESRDNGSTRFTSRSVFVREPGD